MNLCPDCIAAEADRYGIGPINAGRPCCMARAVAGTPRKYHRQAFDAATSALSPLDAHEVRVRAYAIIDARRKRKQGPEL
jgi:hypothetical protein